MAGGHRGRNPRRKVARGASRVGERFTAVVGPIAHGGHCVVRVAPDPSAPDELRVVFTRHCLPGEKVVLEITEGTDGDRFWRGDAVEVLEPSADRVEAPCAVAGACGGCDFQHVALPAQRDLKAAVIAEQFSRLARMNVEVEVEPVAGDLPEQAAGLRWRTRMSYVDLGDGRRGLRRHRSRAVVPVDDCLIAHPDAREPVPGVLVETVESGEGSRRFEVAADGFWQVHSGAPATLVATVLEMLRPQRGERVLDLYAGVGLFGAFLADAVGDPGLVTLIEADASASSFAVGNVPGARVAPGAVEKVLDELDCPPADLVVLDPPREGARRRVVEQVVSCAPRAVAYVACDPAALARDVAVFAEHGYRMTQLRAFDLFPMTHHVECVALLER